MIKTRKFPTKRAGTETHSAKLREIKGSDVQAHLLANLALRGWLAIRVNGICRKIGKSFIRSYIIENNKKSVGFPDVVAFRGGGAGGCNKCILAECKSPKEPLTASQDAFIELAGRCGVKVHVVRSYEDADALVARGN